MHKKRKAESILVTALQTLHLQNNCVSSMFLHTQKMAKNYSDIITIWCCSMTLNLIGVHVLMLANRECEAGSVIQATGMVEYENGSLP